MHRELVALRSQRPRTKGTTRDGESSTEIPAFRQLEHKVHRADTSAAEEDARGDGENTPTEGRERRKGESGEIRREKETGAGIEAATRKTEKMHQGATGLRENGGRRREGRRTARTPFSPFLSSPRLASCICHWVARACRLALARDTRGGHVGGWRRVVDDGGWRR